MGISLDLIDFISLNIVPWKYTLFIIIDPCYLSDRSLMDLYNSLVSCIQNANKVLTHIEILIFWLCVSAQSGLICYCAPSHHFCFISAKGKAASLLLCHHMLTLVYHGSMFHIQGSKTADGRVSRIQGSKTADGELFGCHGDTGLLYNKTWACTFI